MTNAWETELAELLNDLSTVQEELLSTLEAKRECMAARDVAGMQRLQGTESALGERLEACQQRRSAMLAATRESGEAADSLASLAKRLPPGKRDMLGKQVKEAEKRMRWLQHESLTNWVVAQRTVLHLSQMIEIIATGGKLQPTYGKSDVAPARGALVDQQA